MIVGGGPAGSACAWGLRDSGLDVLIVDRAAFPRNKLCGGWITPLVLDELAISPEEYAPGRVLQPISGFRLSSIGGRQVEIRCEKTVSYGIRRCEFDEYLLRRCGARIRDGVPINSIDRWAGGWYIDRNIRAKFLVGAGGNFCPVSRYLGNKGAAAVAAQEIEFEMDAAKAARSEIVGELPELFFCRDIRGYGWVFRKDNYLNVGLGRTDSHEISRHLKDFVAVLKRTRLVETPDKGISGHAYGLYGHAQRTILGDRVLLIGDAAGLAYPESGEGIRPAVESGLMAAHTIVSASGDYSPRRLSLYPELLKSRLHRERNRLDALAQLLPHVVREIAGRQLLRNHSFCRKVVIDQWFLRVAEQRLAFGPQPVQQELTAI